MNNPLYTPIDYIAGVGSARAEVLRSELKISQLRNLLYHFPFRYVDKTQFHRIANINSFVADVQIIGKLQNLKELGEGRKKRLSAELIDETGSVNLIWFSTSDWQKNKIKELLNKDVILFGKPQLFNKKISFTHPELKLFNPKDKLEGILEPVYPSTEKIQKKGISTRVWKKIITEALNLAKGYIRENLSYSILKNYDLIKRETAFQWIHFPPNVDSLEKAQRRLKFEEFFFLHLSLLAQKIIGKKNYSSHAFLEIGDYFNTFYHEYLHFDLTSAQKRVLKEIRSDLGKERQMNRLLQGDVGSGKTIVAFLSMLMAADNGFQSLLMAPTEILAQQHFNGLKTEADKIGLKIALLTGSTPNRERKIIHENLENGEISILVGTHALIEEKVKFKNLGLAIIDEQHRFGVAQRAKLWRKGEKPPHILIMTATPIPRTLSMTLYGDLDCSIIDELPAGRKPIKTVHRKDKDRLSVFNFIASEIAKGRQAYIVYPLIEESEKMDYKDLMDGFESVSHYFPLPKYAISIVHGQMRPDKKEYEMQRFANGETDIMVATTVIEVGVNVPNASIIVIESAEKFGLSQLHQLRGRVGRGAEQSYCILMTKDQLNETAFRRISTMCETNDGFRISEVDLELRGPGNMMGTQQSGLLEFKIADLNKDKEIFLAARYAAENIFNTDPLLQNKENQNIRYFFEKYHLKKIGWANIG